MKILPSIDTLREAFLYDPDSGSLEWRPGYIKRGCRVNGGTAGCKSTGKLIVKLNQKIYSVHRIIWAMVTGEWPIDEVDHKNRDFTDNRWSNLRLASRTENSRNRGMQSNNTCGYVGVLKRGTRYRAYTSNKGKRTYYGTFDTAAEAYEARCRAEREAYGEFSQNYSS